MHLKVHCATFLSHVWPVLVMHMGVLLCSSFFSIGLAHFLKQKLHSQNNMAIVHNSFECLIHQIANASVRLHLHCRSWCPNPIFWLYPIFLTTCLHHLLQFFSIVYTHFLVLETQWPQHVTHSPTPWTNSAEHNSCFTLKLQF